MSVIIKENDLPQELTNEDAVELAYTAELAASVATYYVQEPRT